MKNSRIAFFFTCVALSFAFGQKNFSKVVTFDSLQLNKVQNVSLDDYGNLYIYNSSDFSFSKYDSSGFELGKIMFTLPFKIQSVQNPLNIFAFSENAQEMRLYDENLVEKQKNNFRQNFGSVVMAFGADLENIWLLEDSNKTLIKYKFRDKLVERSYPLTFDFKNLRDLIVYKDLIYILNDDHFSVYNFKSQLVAQLDVSLGKKLRRENNEFYVICSSEIFRWNLTTPFQKVFQVENAENVDKNSSHFLATVKNKLYLYDIENK